MAIDIKEFNEDLTALVSRAIKNGVKAKTITVAEMATTLAAHAEYLTVTFDKLKNEANSKASDSAIVGLDGKPCAPSAIQPSSLKQ